MRRKSLKFENKETNAKILQESDVTESFNGIQRQIFRDWKGDI